MKVIRCMKHATAMLVHSRLRSWLTIIGIVIGVGAVVATMSLGEGLQQAVGQRLDVLGADIVTLSAGFSRGANFIGAPPGGGGFEGGGGAAATASQPTLTRADVQALKSVPDVAVIETEIRGSAKVSYLGKTGSVSLTGVDPAAFSQVNTKTLSAGRMLDAADQNVVLIGGRLASSFFSQPIGVNKMITIQNNSFRVVGIFDDETNSIYTPIQNAYYLLSDKEQGVYDSITIKIRDVNQLNSSMQKIEARLMLSRHVTARTKDFSLSSSSQFQQTRAQLMSSMTMFLIAIAAVSLIVGAVGIANTMFTSVVEKTKEIGIMKAIGARNSDILTIFIFNSGLIGLVGGIFGVILGAILSGFLPALMGDTPFSRGIATVSFNAVLLALGVSFGVGIGAGIVPAYNASKLNPADTLRYE